MGTQETSPFFLVMVLLQACQFTSVSELSLPVEDRVEASLPTARGDIAACEYDGEKDGQGNTQNVILDGTSLEVSGSITGYETHDYVFLGKQESQLSITFSSRYAFPILFQEDTIDLDTNGTPYGIPETGCYRLRILMMRTIARRGIESPYQMTLDITLPSGVELRD